MLPHRLPSLNSLLAFESAARHRSFTRAAGELHLTQGAVSHQIRQLEENLGVALFERVRQRTIITQAGLTYLRDVRRLIAQLTEATHRTMASGTNLILNLGVVPSFATTWIMPRMPGFLDRHPGVTVNFICRNARFDFQSEQLDAAIHYGEDNWAGAFASYLFAEDVIPVCSAAFHARWRIGAEADLAGVPLLQQFTRPAAWDDWFRHAGIQAAQSFRGLRFDNFNMVVAAVKAGLGAALLPRYAVEEDLRNGSILVLSDKGLPSSRGYYFVCPEDKADMPAVVVFRDWIVQVAGESVNTP